MVLNAERPALGKVESTNLHQHSSAWLICMAVVGLAVLSQGGQTVFWPTKDGQIGLIDCQVDSYRSGFKRTRSLVFYTYAKPFTTNYHKCLYEKYAAHLRPIRIRLVSLVVFAKPTLGAKIFSGLSSLSGPQLGIVILLIMSSITWINLAASETQS